MTKIQRLERDIEELTRDELAVFRKWFQEYGSTAWDEQIEQEAAAGKFDKLAEKALADHEVGRTKEI